MSLLGLGVWWCFRRHGKTAWKVALIFVGVGAVCAACRELSWSYVVGNDWSRARALEMVHSFFFPLVVAVALMVAMGWTFKTWLFRLVFSGLAAGTVSVLLIWFFGAYGRGWPQQVFVVGPLFVGAIFGVVSGLSMVRSRKVLV